MFNYLKFHYRGAPRPLRREGQTCKRGRGVCWDDGVQFISADVAFTLTAIQKPDSRSPLASSWQGVTVDTPDDHTVTFKLPQPLNSFMDSTTVGIVPRHLLE